MSQELIRIIKQAAIDAVDQSSPVNVAYGIVESIDPLKIKVEDKFIIDEEMILLTPSVIDRQTKISFDNPGIVNIVNGYSETSRIDRLSYQANIKNEITIYDGLKKGEELLLLRVQGGQKYIVLYRLVKP